MRDEWFALLVEYENPDSSTERGDVAIVAAAALARAAATEGAILLGPGQEVDSRPHARGWHRCSTASCRAGRSRLKPGSRITGVWQRRRFAGSWRTARRWGQRVTPATSVAASVRSATQGDVPAIVDIERISFGDPWFEATFRDLLRLRHAIFLVATEGRGGSVCGYVIAAVVAGEAEILNLAVAPQSRAAASEADSSTLDLESLASGERERFSRVRESNSAALALYTSRGFATLTRRARYYRNPVEDALVLRRAVEG